MTWPEGVRGRALAAVYLVAFVVTYAGVVWIFVRQLTGVDSFMGGGALLVFAVGALTLTALSVVLRNRVPARTNKLTKNMAGDQRAYHRLALGVELPGAWRVATGRGAGAGAERAN